MARYRRFEALDGLRGITALAVAFAHINQDTLGYVVLPNGNLAVPFFFMLSGFVLSYVYRDRLKQDLSLTTYLWQRAIRLTPLIVLSGIVASGHLFLRYRSGQLPGIDDAKFLMAVLSSLTAMPVPFLDIGNWRWPANPPLWSMFWEIVASVMLGSFALFLRVRSLVAAAAFATPLILVSAARGGVVGEGITGGAMLACYCFCMGIVLDKIHDRLPDLLKRAGCVAVGLFVVLLALPIAFGGNLTLTAMIVLFLPLVLVGGASLSPVGWPSKICAVGGRLSYPLYLLHFPVSHWSMQLGFVPTDIVQGVGMLAICVAASAVVLRLYDEPVRAWLTALDLSAAPAQPKPV